MLKQAFVFLIVYIGIYYPVLINSDEDFNPNDFETLGPTLAANDQLIISVQDRKGITFSAVLNYLTSPQYCALTYPVPNGTEMYVTAIALRKAFSSDNQFVFVAHSILNETTHMYIASITFSPCTLNLVTSPKYMFNTTYPPYSVLGVTSDGKLAIYLTDTNIFIQSLIPTYSSSVWGPFVRPSYNYLYIPTAITLQDSWGILALFSRYNSISYKYRPAIYYLNFINCSTSLNSTCLKFSFTTTLTYVPSWQAQVAPPNNALDNNYNALYSMSLSQNDNNEFLIGVQFMNTVFRYRISSSSFSYINRRCPGVIANTGFGKGVGWLDNNTIAILSNNFTIDYIQWRSSKIELYPITTSSFSFSNTISPYASYPSDRQRLWPELNERLINMLALPGSGSLIYMDYLAKVHVIRPSDTGYYAYTEGGLTDTNNTIAIAPNLRCSSGTIKNIDAHGKDIFRYCLLCPEGSYYSASGSNTASICLACNTTEQFCPWGAVAALPISVLDTYSQTQVYPQSPENDNFEDILLINMFNIDFPLNCLFNIPLFYGLIIIGVGCLFLLFMGILKLTKKCRKQRRMIKKVFKQTDLIGEGELWIGGVASFAVLVLAVFAYRFSDAFMRQYPLETAGDATFACDPTLRNAKFSTSMQSLGTPILDSDQPIFDMLDKQPFTLNVVFLNTDFLANQSNVSQVVGSFLLDLPKKTKETDGILEVSVNLTSHASTILFNVSSDSAVGGFRIGLQGPSKTFENYVVQELNFSYAFNHSNRTLTQDPSITIQLIKLINTTEPLSGNGQTLYSALWIPTFIKNDDQLFYSESDFQRYHFHDNTILTVQITEATYYIFNQQEPITKLTEIIFTNILFTTMCIELFALTFLFYKLALSPFIKALLSLCIKPKTNKITPTSVDSGHGCPYCRSVDGDTLTGNRLPIQRAIGEIPLHSVRRQTPDVYNVPVLNTSKDLLYQ